MVYWAMGSFVFIVHNQTFSMPLNSHVSLNFKYCRSLLCLKHSMSFSVLLCSDNEILKCYWNINTCLLIAFLHEVFHLHQRFVCLIKSSRVQGSPVTVVVLLRDPLAALLPLVEMSTAPPSISHLGQSRASHRWRSTKVQFYAGSNSFWGAQIELKQQIIAFYPGIWIQIGK